MNLKTKAVALLAGSALALSVASGAMATGTGVTLNDGGTCSVGISSGDVDFGTYTWNPGTQEFDKDANGSGSITLSASDNTRGQAGCDVTLSGGDMDDDTTGLIVIDVDYSHGGSIAADSVTVSVVAGTDETVTASVPANLGPSYTIDGYSGTITVTQEGGAQG